jgi:hypothetical protein
MAVKATASAGNISRNFFCICPIIYKGGLDIADVQPLRGAFDMELRSGQVKCTDFVLARN